MKSRWRQDKEVGKVCVEHGIFPCGACEVEDLKAELAAAREHCEKSMKNIRTWMPDGFKSHCTDAMIIMQSRIDAKDAELAKLRALCAEAGPVVHDLNYDEMARIGQLAETLIAAGKGEGK